MKYLVIKGVNEVIFRETVLGKEWRLYVVDGNGNGVMVEAEKGLVEAVRGMMKRERDKGATRGEEVE